MDLQALIGKSGDAGVLRERIGFAAKRLMGLRGRERGSPKPRQEEVGAKAGAGYGEKNPSRLA